MNNVFCQRIFSPTLLTLLFLVTALSATAQEEKPGGEVRLVRTAAPEPENIAPVLKGLPGTWTGVISTPSRSIPLSVTLTYDGRKLVGSIGPDSEHQSAWPISASDGVVHFQPDTVSEIRLHLSKGQLTGEIIRAVSDARPTVPLPDETVGFERIVPALISVFDYADILALGESGHRRKIDSDLRIQLVRHPDFARKVRFIIVEFGNEDFQNILDRYLQGEDVPEQELQQIWKVTTQMGVWESPVYPAFFAAVREVNMKLPHNERIRIFVADPSPRSAETRNSLPAALIRRVMADGGKALVLYGSRHFDRYAPGITNLVQSTNPGRMFVVEVSGGADSRYQVFEDALKSTERPVLFSLTRAPFRNLSTEVFGPLASVRLTVEGVLALGQIAEACVYLGMTRDVETMVDPSLPQLPLDISGLRDQRPNDNSSTPPGVWR